MQNPYQPLQQDPLLSGGRDSPGEYNPVGLAAVASLVLAAAWFTAGMPVLTVALTAGLGVAACLFIPRRQLRPFIWFIVLGLVVAVVGTGTFISVRYGEVDSYAASARNRQAFHDLFIVALPCCTLLGATVGVLYPGSAWKTDEA